MNEVIMKMYHGWMKHSKEDAHFRLEAIAISNKGIATSSKKLVVAPGITTSNKNATRLEAIAISNKGIATSSKKLRSGLLFNLILIANIVTTSKALVTTSDAPVTTSFLYVLMRSYFFTSSLRRSHKDRKRFDSGKGSCRTLGPGHQLPREFEASKNLDARLC